MRDDITIDPPPDLAPHGRTSLHRASHGAIEVVVKRATGRDRSRLRHEADLIERVGSRRVVELVELLDDDEHTDLVLVDAGARTVADLDLSTPELTLRALQRLGEAVADLHEIGWSHGAICAEHAVVAPRGTVRLCSMSSARPLGAGTTSDDDIAALLAVVHGVAARPVDDLGPVAATRSRLTARRLRRLADRALHDQEHQGVEARELVRQLRLFRARHEVDPPRRTAAPLGRVRSAAASWRSPAAAAAVALLALVALCLIVVRSDPPQDLTTGPSTSATTPTSASTALPGPTTVAGPTTAVTTAGITDPSGASAAGCEGLSVDIDGDGCDDLVTVEGEVLHVDDRSYALGIPGDVVVVGDWNCDGVATARLWRATSGEVFEFHDWATADADTVGVLVGSVAGSVGIVRGDDPRRDGCDVLHVVDADGQQEEL